MTPLTFAIFGFGKMGQIRYDTIQKLASCRVAGVCEIGAGAPVPEGVLHAKDPQVFLEDPAIDAVVICTPNDLLAPLTVKALQAGKHVFCEKPPGRNMRELNTMIEAEKSSGRKLMFGFNHRHHESMLHTKKLINSGEYGKILWMRGRYGKSVDEKFFANWRSKKAIAGGGIFLDQGIHMLDLFLMFCGDFDEVHAYVSNLYWKLDIEDNVFAIFRNKQGQVASLHSTMTQWRHIFSLEIFLERGYITINGLKTSSNTYGDEEMTIAQNRTMPPAAMWTQEENITFHTDYSWEKEMNVFIDSVRRQRPVPAGNTQDALKLMRLVEQVYKNR
ncbi:MAG: Gfo/Idh/MocA family oxidoreductase [Candidatus Omnitrophica bacterium]|nr:Gfo/Idh/MocA family oxidoreductase [Candidatus Omnitrophota bacterium]